MHIATYTEKLPKPSPKPMPIIEYIISMLRIWWIHRSVAKVNALIFTVFAETEQDGTLAKSRLTLRTISLLEQQRKTIVKHASIHTTIKKMLPEL
jgi:hypothetical protein